MDIKQRILDEKIIAIVRGVRPENMMDVAKAVRAGGITALEITFDHKTENGIAETLESIRMLKAAKELDLLIGAGTVITPEEVDMAAEAGAEYMISPDTNVEVIRRTKELGKISMPGAFTASEVTTAHFAGADIVKLFPAGLFGVDYVKAIRGPLGFIKFSAVGGVNVDNAAAFLKAGYDCLGIGSNLVDLKAVARGDYKQIEETSRAYVKAVAAAKA